MCEFVCDCLYMCHLACVCLCVFRCACVCGCVFAYVARVFAGVCGRARVLVLLASGCVSSCVSVRGRVCLCALPCVCVSLRLCARVCGLCVCLFV